MPTSSAKSSSNSHSRFKKKIEVKCWCEDLCPVFVSRTPENPGKKFWGCPIYKGEGGCGFFRWVDDEGIQKQDMMPESNCITEQRQMMALMQMVVVLLGAILFILVLVLCKI
ncbi:unnamed protein product [Lactuca virosa]|uniref:GRF-type domain-containing protein n=1 Tax=Lactuca virosa TaxID=75947 RepID=A0AAU9N6X0_9ASTR|nr:unnamed protein product [Lactuca virosa]